MQKSLSLMFILLCGFLSSFGEAASPKEHLQRGLAAHAQKDYATAMREFQQGAQQGEPNCQYYLGHMYMFGQGVARNETEAAKWVHKAADQGHDRSLLAMGYLYEEGRGVPRDLGQAQSWYKKAVQTCDLSDPCTTPKKALDRVAYKLAISPLDRTQPSSGANQGRSSTDRTQPSSGANQGIFECTATGIYAVCDETPSGGMLKGCYDYDTSGRAFGEDEGMTKIKAMHSCESHMIQMTMIKSQHNSVKIKQQCTASCRPTR